MHLKRTVVTLALVLATQCALAKDWKKVIDELEREPPTPTNRKLLPLAYNNYAIALSQDSKWHEAEALLEKAVLLDPKGGYQANLAMVYLSHAGELVRQRASKGQAGRKHQEAKRYAQKALVHDKKLAKAHLLLGDIAYENQQLAEAKAAWDAAAKLNPKLSGLDKRQASLRKEQRVESKLKKRETSFFEMRFEQDLAPQTAQALNLAAEAARKSVGQDLTYRPRHKIVILAYAPSTFAKVQRGPHWAGGSYDGKIRLPLASRATEKQLTRAVATLFHEYTHASIHDLAHGHAPRWLHEGLAQHQEAKIAEVTTATLTAAAARRKLIPLKSLEDAFLSSSSATARLAYEQAYSLTGFLIKSKGYGRIKRLLGRLGEEVPFELALRETCNLNGIALETQWKQWLAATK